MTACITADNRFQRGDGSSTMECPHCGAVTHMTLSACPSFARLRGERPAQVGIVLQCDACRTPVFLRYRTRAYLDDRVELHAMPQEVEHAAERFSLNYLPPAVAARFREALACYSHGLWQAFAAMIRVTAQAVFEDVGETGRLRIFDQVREVQALADIDDETFSVVRRVLFESPGGRTQPEPELDRRQAAVLLETSKDLLNQAYVRRAKLRQALKVRRFFAEQSGAAAPIPPLPARNVSNF